MTEKTSWNPPILVRDPTDLTSEQAAEKLGVTKKRIHALCREGRFPNAYKVGIEWRIPVNDLNQPGIKNRHLGRPAKTEKP